ncbi:MAG TPA: malto-oligosyltrehalose trehalohydrolase [Pyrinomonadaceae bacterium]|jgi:maltooligosyltrehalose trehalohydrolase|nr:malto-oligosyltrehalose trehalohydrolase [Pyrinomonadaceae bacterium]
MEQSSRTGATNPRRRLHVGAEVVPEGGVHFRVWAPRRSRVEVVFESDGRQTSTELRAEDEGYFSAHVRAGVAGTLYRFRLDGEDYLYPDPASRFQPGGPHQPSRVVDPSAFRWADAEWKGAALKGQVIYELHVGTFTREGTWAAAARELKGLSELGVTCIEMMPVADFPGRFGWGYDGVSMFAPTRLYGQPDDLRRFVDDAHRHHVAVILDVVYNHFGPDGNYLRQFSEDYFTDRRQTEWGEPINFDGPNSKHVREFFIANARYWVEEFHMDGLRLDATQSIFDDSDEHILAAISREVRAAAGGRETIIVAENEAQEARLARPPARGGFGLDGLWNDDFHHSALVALTGRNEAYYTDHRGAPQEFISAVKYGYLYQGQRYKWQRKRRGSPALDLPPEAFVNFIENHDQVANSARGLRVHALTSPGRFRALTALVLLAPSTPMLFQGQEFAASAPFLYFADHEPELARKVRRGRVEFLAQFRSIATKEARAGLAAPEDEQTFERCKLDFRERESHKMIYEMHRDLLRLRREEAVFSAQARGGVDGAVLGPEAFVLRFFGEDGDDRLLFVNLGADLNLNPAPEPLLAPPEGRLWTLLWSSEDFGYGGGGTPPPETKNNWIVPGHAALVMRPAAASVVRDLVRDLARGGDGMGEEEETRRDNMQDWEEE